VCGHYPKILEFQADFCYNLNTKKIKILIFLLKKMVKKENKSIVKKIITELKILPYWRV